MPLDSSFSVPAPKVQPLIPADMYQLELVDVEQKEFENFETHVMEKKLSFKFAILDDGMWYGAFQFVTTAISLHEKSNLRRFFAPIVRRHPTADEVKNPGKVLTVDFLNSMIGSQVRANVSQEMNKNQKLVNKITSFLPTKEKLPALDQEKAKAAYAKRAELPTT